MSLYKGRGSVKPVLQLLAYIHPVGSGESIRPRPAEQTGNLSQEDGIHSSVTSDN